MRTLGEKDSFEPKRSGNSASWHQVRAKRPWKVPFRMHYAFYGISNSCVCSAHASQDGQRGPRIETDKKMANSRITIIYIYMLCMYIYINIYTHVLDIYIYTLYTEYFDSF